jgi:hypothetical protein
VDIACREVTSDSGSPRGRSLATDCIIQPRFGELLPMDRFVVVMSRSRAPSAYRRVGRDRVVGW